MNVLVTGGAGFIGSHVAKALAQAGHTPIAFDNLSRGNRWAVKYGPFEEGDIRDAARLAEVFARYRPTGVIHMAALAYVRESVLDPLAYYANNIGGSVSLVAAMQKAGCGAIVFSSTCATYGVARQVPITEDHPTDPINPYGASKLAVERVLRDAEAAGGPRFVALRYFNAAGSDPDGEIGESHDPETHVIPLCMMAARGEIESFTLLGEDHATPDGTPLRDYIHVSDLADAHVRALEHLMSGGASDILNLGTGQRYSVKDVIGAVERVSGLKVPVTVLPRHPADPPVLVAEGLRARERIGFAPRYLSLDDMVRHAWAWRARDDDQRRRAAGRN